MEGSIGPPPAGAGQRMLLHIGEVRFSQASIFPTITNGTPLSEFFQMITSTGWNDEFDPPRVIRVQGSTSTAYVAFDNRRSVTLRWMANAGLKESANFLVFDSDDELLEEIKSADIGLKNIKFAVDVNEEDLQELATSLGISLERLASQRSYEVGDRPKTWGDVLLARTSSQRKWGAPNFPLLGQVQLPWVKWDILAPYVAHCQRLQSLPKDHPIVHFAQPPSMFDRRTKSSLVELLRSISQEDADMVIENGTPEFGPQLRRLLENIHRWIDDVLEGNVHCVKYAWRQRHIHFGSVADGRGQLRALDLTFHSARVDLVAELVWNEGAVLHLEVPLAERMPEVATEDPIPSTVTCSETLETDKYLSVPVTPFQAVADSHVALTTTLSS